MATTKSEENYQLLRKEMSAEKDFLKKLYHENDTKKTRFMLSCASVKRLRLLVKILHMMFTGKIELCTKKLQQLHYGAKKLRSIKKLYESKNSVRALNKGGRESVLTELNKIAPFLKHLLCKLFEK
ncbi:MAG TPA: hypothetical protein VIY47_00165 [Ignavibacteriaceae bacterium]